MGSVSNLNHYFQGKEVFMASIKERINASTTSVTNGKDLIAKAITNNLGSEATKSETFNSLASKIKNSGSISGNKISSLKGTLKGTLSLYTEPLLMSMYKTLIINTQISCHNPLNIFNGNCYFIYSAGYEDYPILYKAIPSGSTTVCYLSKRLNPQVPYYVNTSDGSVSMYVANIVGIVGYNTQECSLVKVNVSSGTTSSINTVMYGYPIRVLDTNQMFFQSTDSRSNSIYTLLNTNSNTITTYPSMNFSYSLNYISSIKLGNYVYLVSDRSLFRGSLGSSTVTTLGYFLKRTNILPDSTIINIHLFNNKIFIIIPGINYGESEIDIFNLSTGEIDQLPLTLAISNLTDNYSNYYIAIVDIYLNRILLTDYDAKYTIAFQPEN